MKEPLRVDVDRTLCDNHGQCVFTAPQVFAFDDDEELVYDARPAPEHLTAVQAAVRACPARAISLTSQSGPG
jgi:ferredoxin